MSLCDKLFESNDNDRKNKVDKKNKKVQLECDPFCLGIKKNYNMKY